MTRTQKREFRKVWRTLKTGMKWLLLVILVFLLLSLIKDFLDGYNLLIEKVNQQQAHIDYLQGELHGINEQLQETQVQLETIDAKINERLIQQPPQVNIGGQPITMTPEELEEEVKPQLKEPSMVPVTIVAILQILKSLVLKVPSF